MAKLSEDLDQFLRQSDLGEMIALRELQDLAGERGFGFLLTLLALPSALPVPAPGYSVPFGVALLLIATQMIAGNPKLWLPMRVRRWSVPTSFASSVLEKGSWLLKRIELISRPRLLWLCKGGIGRRVLGCAIALMSISMMIPIPGTNTLPAFAIFVMGFGLLDDDGLVASAGLFFAACGALLTGLILTVGVEAVKAAIEWLRMQF